MKITAENRVYSVSWRYGTKESSWIWHRRSKNPEDPPPKPPDQEWTRCVIHDITAGDENPPVVAFTQVVRHSEDVPNREIARKESLRAALDVAFGPYLKSQAPNREIRRIFWREYFARKNKGDYDEHHRAV
jgi:hypothetical protein